MPSRAACCCTSSEAKWAARVGTGGAPGAWCAGAGELDCIGHLGLLRVHVEGGLVLVDGLRNDEVGGGGRGLGQPLVTAAVPRVGGGLLTVHQRVGEVDGGDE